MVTDLTVEEFVERYNTMYKPATKVTHLYPDRIRAMFIRGWALDAQTCIVVFKPEIANRTNPIVSLYGIASDKAIVNAAMNLDVFQLLQSIDMQPISVLFSGNIK